MSRRLIWADAVRTPVGLVGDAVLIEDRSVAAVGRAADLRADGTAEFGYPGAVIVPGLRDAHFHPVTYAAALARPSLKSAADFDEIGERLRDAADRLPAGAPLIAFRLDDESLAEGRLPTRGDLDRLLGRRPILLHRYCGHVAVASTAALDLAGLSPDAPDPPGGSLDRDDSGAPTGVLRETAVELVAAPLAGSAGPQPTTEQIVTALAGLAGLGLTGIGAILDCAEGGWAGAGDEIALMSRAAADLPIRVDALVVARTPSHLEEAAERISSAGSPRLRFLGLKAFGDGSLGGHTAALRDPFSDRQGESGTLRLDPEWAASLAKRALEIGERVAVHAIGDLANSAVLDLFERLISAGTDPAGLRVEHASVLGRTEIERFADLGVTASVQPAFLASETGWLEKRLGPDRLRTTYPFRTLLERGVPLAGGSDCPVEPPHPLWGMAAARDRSGLVPEEGLGGAQALSLFTDGAARALAQPEPLRPGAPADLTVLDGDPVEAGADELRQTTVVATWVDGAPVAVPDDAVVWED